MTLLGTARRLAADGLADTRHAVHALRAGAPALPDELAWRAGEHEERHASHAKP